MAALRADGFVRAAVDVTRGDGAPTVTSARTKPTAALPSMALKAPRGRRNPHLLDAHALGPSGSSAAVEGDTGEDGGSGRAPDPCDVA